MFMNPPMSEEGRSVQLSGDEDAFPFYSLDTGKRKYQQRRLKPQTEMLEKDAISSASGDKLNRPSGRRKKRFVGVRQRSSGRWVAEIKDTTQKIRLWLGTFDTAEDAARAYDEAACMLRGMNTRTNFMPSPASASVSVLPSKAARALHQRLKNSASVVKNSNLKSWEMNSIPSNLPGLSCSMGGKSDCSTQHQGFSGYFDHDEEAGYKSSSITSMLSSPSFKGIHDILQNVDRPLNFHTDDQFAGFEVFSASMEYQQQNNHSFSSASHEFKSQEREDSPDSSADLSETLSDLVNSGESSSLFDFSVEIPMPSCSFDEISGIGGLGDLSEIHGAAVSADTEQIRRFHFERVSSASLYAMNGVQELLMRSGELSNKSSVTSSSSFGRSPSFRGLKSPMLPCSKMLKSPGWILSSPPGNPPAAHKSGEYQTTSSDASWTAHLCRVA